MRGANRNNQAPADRNNNLGFRCAKTMENQLKNSPFYRDGFLMRMKPDQPVTDDACADAKQNF